MSYITAITGKGGVGKTTVAAILVNRMIDRGCHPVLAIDADPNTCLDSALGIRVEKTIGGAREEAREFAQKGMSEGIDKQRWLELKIAQSLVESQHFDLIAMGRSEGPGCYCYANNILKSAIGQLVIQYPYIVLDNEAGLENLSRRIVQEVDSMVMVTDPSARGMDTVERLHALADEMGIVYKNLVIIVNRTRREELPSYAAKLAAAIKPRCIITLPDNEEIKDFSEAGKNLTLLDHNNPVVKKLDTLLDDLGLLKTHKKMDK